MANTSLNKPAIRLPKPQAIIFDWDNTLVNSWPVIHAALEKTFIDMGMTPWTLEETMQRVSKSMRDSFPILFGDNWQKAADLYQSYYRASHLQDLQALPGAEELLRRIKKQQLYCVVVSNKKGGTLRQEIAHLQWDAYFDAMVGSTDAAHDKPHAAPVELAFKESGIEVGPAVWFIGDSEIDLECARNVGCTAVLYGESAQKSPKRTASHYHGFPYHAYASHHTELLALLS